MDWKDWKLSYTSDVFGPLYGGGSVKAAAVRTLELWLPTYIGEINRQLGAPVLYVPRTYLYQADERPVAPKTSQVTVSVPKTVGTPQRSASSGTRAIWQCEVRVFFAGSQDWNESEAIAQAYLAATRGVMVQQGGLEGFAQSTTWAGEALGAGKRSGTYYRVAAMNVFHVSVTNVVGPYGGPPAPSPFTPAARPEAESTNVLTEPLDD